MKEVPRQIQTRMIYDSFPIELPARGDDCVPPPQKRLIRRLSRLFAPFIALWSERFQARAGVALRGVRASRFARDAAMLTGISGIERLSALVQTVLIARALGIVEYGVYGLMFTSIGFIASIMGLQMGLTATVLIARYRDAEKARAGAVIRHVTRFAWLVSLAFWAVSLPFSGAISQWLLHSPAYTLAAALGSLYVGVALLSGVQDGVVQGFEDFRALATARFVAAVATLAAVYPAAKSFGLNGVVAAILGGVLLKMLMLAGVVRGHRRQQQIPSEGGDVKFMAMVLEFSLPSMLVSLMTGGVLWYGSLLLSRQHAGFESIAIVNIGLQWRGPILLLAGALGSVAVPMFSRHSGARDLAASRRLRKNLLWINGVAALASASLLIVGAPLLLSMYGSGFSGGGVIFAILVGTTVPAVLANVFMQELVGAGRLWLQLLLHLPMVLLTASGFMLLIPRSQGYGYAVSVAAASFLFLACAALARGRGIRTAP